MASPHAVPTGTALRIDVSLSAPRTDRSGPFALLDLSPNRTTNGDSAEPSRLGFPLTRGPDDHLSGDSTFHASATHPGFAPAGDLNHIADNIWRVRTFHDGGRDERSMTLVRRADGDLVAYGPLPLDPQRRAMLDAIGLLKYILVPSAAYRANARALKQLYPHAQVLAPRGLVDRVEALVPVDGIFEDFPLDDAVAVRMLHGAADTEGVMVVRSSDGVTVVLSAAVVDMSRSRHRARALLTSLRRPDRASRLLLWKQLLFAKNRSALREDLQRLADEPELVRVVAPTMMALGADAADKLRDAACRLAEAPSRSSRQRRRPPPAGERGAKARR